MLAKGSIDQTMSGPQKYTIDEALAGVVPDYRRGDRGAADRLRTLLRAPVSRVVARSLGEDSGDLDDVVQQTLLATLQYLDRDAEFAGDLERLSVTIARNRCQDLVGRPASAMGSLSDWLADPRRSVLDEIDQTQRLTLLQSALGRLSTDHRALLRAMYLDGLTAESVRRRLGLGTVHGVYYRRSVCLRQVKSFLRRWLRKHSELDAGHECIDPRLGGDLWRLEDPDAEVALRARLETHVTFCASCRQQRAVESATAAGLRMGELALGSSAGRGLRRIRWLAGAGTVALAGGLALLLVHRAGWIIGALGAAALLSAGVLRHRRRDYGSAL